MITLETRTGDDFLKSANTLLECRAKHFTNFVARNGYSSLDEMVAANHPQATHAAFLRTEAIDLADKISTFIHSVQELQKLGV